MLSTLTGAAPRARKESPQASALRLCSPSPSAALRVGDLVPIAVEAFYRDEIGVGHALLLAKLPANQQEQALSACFREDWSGSSDRKAKRILLPVRSLTDAQVR